MNIATDFANDIREIHAALARIAPQSSGVFKAVITVNSEGETKPLLLVGNAHAACDDGGCIAILNPARDLANEIQPGCAYAPGHLRKLVARRCEQMAQFWFDHYKSPESRVSVLGSYTSKTSRPVEIKVGDFGLRPNAFKDWASAPHKSRA